jgi:hypothetical protein
MIRLQECVFLNWFLRSVHDGAFGRHLVCFSREAWFLLHGEVNSQNKWYWSAESPGLIHEYPFLTGGFFSVNDELTT